MTPERRATLAALTATLGELSIPYAENDPLSRRTSFRIGGPAALTVTPRNRAELIALLDLCREQAGGCPVLLLGRGSNVLFSDEGYAGVVIRTTEVRRVVFDTACDACEPSGLIYADCGASLSALAAACVTEGRSLAGLAFVHGIPGSVGGAVVMNAGAYGGEMAQVVTEVTCLTADGEIETVTDFDFGYRTSVFKDGSRMILSAAFKLEQGDREAIKARMDELSAQRQAKQPLEYPSAGSMFKRPVGYFAGALIEQAGLKGFTVGGAQVSEKHAGFVINRGGATCSDVLELVRRVQEKIRADVGVDLEMEVKILR